MMRAALLGLIADWKSTATMFAVAGFLATAIIAGRALVAMPAKLDQHTVQTDKQTEILTKMLCIQIADHRHSDWTHCIINTN